MRIWLLSRDKNIFTHFKDLIYSPIFYNKITNLIMMIIIIIPKQLTTLLMRHPRLLVYLLQDFKNLIHTSQLLNRLSSEVASTSLNWIISVRSLGRRIRRQSVASTSTNFLRNFPRKLTRLFDVSLYAAQTWSITIKTCDLAINSRCAINLN